MKKELAYGFVKNRYVGRTFIMPDQQLRRTSVRRKLNPIKSEFYGKKVLLVDDSIVRGTTMKEIVQMCYAAGALKVSVASAAPEVSSLMFMALIWLLGVSLWHIIELRKR